MTQTQTELSPREAFLLRRKERIETYLAKKKLEKQEFAKQLGHSRAFISNIINGKRIGSPSVLAKIERLTRGKLKMIDMVPPEA